jgi:hypothetical protein
MSSPAVRKISLTPEALAALNAESTEPVRPAPQPLPPMAVQVIRKQIAEAVFGPSMKPTFRQQLLAFSSFSAIKAGWAAAHWQLKMKEKYG